MMRLFGFFKVPDPFTFNHWQALTSDPAFLGGVRNSLVIATSSAVLVVVLYSTIAYVVVRNSGLAVRAVDTLVWSPWSMPGIVMSLGFCGSSWLRPRARRGTAACWASLWPL